MKRLALVILLAVVLMFLIGCTPSKGASMPLVLLTDYGTDDYRAPRLKGIIYSASPDVRMIDATHGITGMDIAAGAYVLDLTAKEFPADVVFIAAVGSPARQDEQYLALLTNKGQIFLSPNNGLLTYVINDMGIKEVYFITNSELFDRPEGSLSAHYILGRVGALIASGRPIQDVGPAANSPVMLDIQTATYVDGKLKGTVVFIDHFGSCLTNITGADFGQLGLAIGEVFQVTVSGTKIPIRLGTTYSSVAAGEEVAFVNSLGVLQLSLNSAGFAGKYNLKTGAKIEVE